MKGVYRPILTPIPQEGYVNTTQLPRQIDRFVRQQRHEVLMARVFNVQKQNVSGTNYKITYRTPKGDSYQAVVYDHSWTNIRKLSSFNKLN